MSSSLRLVQACTNEFLRPRCFQRHVHLHRTASRKYTPDAEFSSGSQYRFPLENREKFLERLIINFRTNTHRPWIQANWWLTTRQQDPMKTFLRRKQWFQGISATVVLALVVLPPIWFVMGILGQLFLPRWSRQTRPHTIPPDSSYCGQCNLRCPTLFPILTTHSRRLLLLVMVSSLFRFDWMLHPDKVIGWIGSSCREHTQRTGKANLTNHVGTRLTKRDDDMKDKGEST